MKKKIFFKIKNYLKKRDEKTEKIHFKKKEK